MPKSQKNAKLNNKKNIYHCECCDFITYKKSNYLKHLSTRKHQKRINLGNDFVKKMPKQKKMPKSKSYICECGKVFKTSSGLWKHQKKCKIVKKNGIFFISKISKNISKILPDHKLEKSEDIDIKIKQIQLENEILMNEKLKKEINQLDNPEPLTNLLTNELVETIGKIAGNNN